MNRLVIDDLRTHVDGGTHARTSAEGLVIVTQQWDEIWLDHDLGPDDDIMTVVDVLCRAAFEGMPYCTHLKRTPMFVHSQNPVGAANVVRSLAKYGYSVKRTGVEKFVV
jgi:hypothetical protein